MQVQQNKTKTHNTVMWILVHWCFKFQEAGLESDSSTTVSKDPHFLYERRKASEILGFGKLLQPGKPWLRLWHSRDWVADRFAQPKGATEREKHPTLKPARFCLQKDLPPKEFLQLWRSWILNHWHIFFASWKYAKRLWSISWHGHVFCKNNCCWAPLS